jgi:cysteine desulfurase
MKTIYLDHAATTPVDPAVRIAMEPYMSAGFGNPSSIHRMGQRARMALDEARESVASDVGATPAEILFTSGGTESDNAAIRGAAFAGGAAGRKHLVVTAIEHEAVLEACLDLEYRWGFEVTRVNPDREGIVAVDAVAEAIRSDTSVVSVMYANNEIGTIQPVSQIGALCRDRGVTFHVDAVQAAGVLPIDVNRDNIDLLALSAHKFYGPKGVGALYVRKGIPWWPSQLGGGQERGRRSGTENVPGIVGLATALKLALEAASETREQLQEMRDYIFDWLLRKTTDSVANGSRLARLPSNVNVSFPGVSGEALVMALDSKGIMASSGSACSSGSTEPSHVLQAIGCSPDVAGGALRLTLGRENTWDDVYETVQEVAEATRRLSNWPATMGKSR